MGDTLSKSNPNSSSSSPPPPTSTTTTTMPSSNPSQTHDSAPQTDPTHQPKLQTSSDPPPPNDSVLKGEETKKIVEKDWGSGFRLFMKDGGCKDAFINWENCVEEGEENKEDIVIKCVDLHIAFNDCMLANPNYYSAILPAEEVDESLKKLEKEKERENEENNQSKSQESSDPPPTETTENSPQDETDSTGEEKKEDGEEEEECGFCLFMKSGGCKDEFVNWENCVEEAENNKEDIVDKCFEITRALKDCMLAHPDHYSPILRAEEMAEAEAAKEIEKEKEREREENTQKEASS